MPSTRSLAFTAAERMVDRIHGDAADVRPLAEPAAPARLADRHVLVIEVADLPDRRVALDEDLPDLARRQLDRRVLAFLGDELHGRSGAPRDLSALARPQLHVMDEGAERNVLQDRKSTRLNSSHSSISYAVFCLKKKR